MCCLLMFRKWTTPPSIAKIVNCRLQRHSNVNLHQLQPSLLCEAMYETWTWKSVCVNCYFDESWLWGWFNCMVSDSAAGFQKNRASSWSPLPTKVIFPLWLLQIPFVMNVRYNEEKHILLLACCFSELYLMSWTLHCCFVGVLQSLQLSSVVKMLSERR